MSIRLSVLAIVLVSLCPCQAGSADKPRIDSHGFPLPEGAVARLGDLHYAQPGAITALALSPDGKVVATAGPSVYLWNADTGRITRTISITEPIRMLVFSSNGKLLAGGDDDREILVWDTRTGKSIGPMPNGRARPATAPIISAGGPFAEAWQTEWTGMRFIDNDRLLTASRIDQDASSRRHFHLQVWDLDRKSLVQSWGTDKFSKTFSILKGNELAWVTLSPTGEQAAWLTAPYSLKDGNSSVLLQETRSGKAVRELKGLRAPAERLSFCDANHGLLLQSTHFRYKPENDKSRDKATYVLVSEGNHDVIDSNDGKTRFSFDYRTSDSINRTLGEKLYVHVLAHSPDGKAIYTQDEVGVVCRDLATGKILKAWNEQWSGLAYSQDGNRAVIAKGARLHVCDRDLKPIRKSDDFSEAPTIQFRADGRLVAFQPYGGRMRVWDLEKRSVLETRQRHAAPTIGRAPWSHDYWHELCTYSNDKGVVIHDLVANKIRCRLDMEKPNSTWDASASFSSDGSRVLVAVRKKNSIVVQWFETCAGRKLGEHLIDVRIVFTHQVRFVDWYSTDGSVFGYVTNDHKLVLVDSAKNKTCAIIGIPVPPPPPSRGIGTDGFNTAPRTSTWEYQASSRGRIITASRVGDEYCITEYCLVLGETGELLRRFVLEDGELVARHRHTVISPDGRLVALHGAASFSPRDSIFIFDTLTGRLRGKIVAPSGVEAVDFSPDGKTLATSCADTTILLWDLQRPLGEGTSPSRRLTDIEMERAWTALADPAEMESALWSMIATPDKTLPFLKQRLAPVKVIDPKEIEALIAALDSSSFREREAAKEKLIALEEIALPALHRAQLQHFSLEQGRRIQSILKFIDRGKIPPVQREVRAIEVLERIGSAEARSLLESIARGAENAFVTREARWALTRFPK